MNSEDTEIIQRVKRGNSNAYGILIRKYHYHLLNFINRIVRDSTLVEDIGQEVFISVFRNLSDFNEQRGVPFSAWLFIIARNRCISELRKRKKMVFEPIITDIPAVGCECDPEAVHIHSEQFNQLKAALEQLEEPFKEALIKSLRGHSIDEISCECNVPINTVKTRLFRARQKLRVSLKAFK